MPEISPKNGVATLILDFTVKPDKILQLSKLAQQNIMDVISKKEGFVSANIHESSSGSRLVNYSQWKSRESYEKAIDFLSHEEVVLGEKLLDLGDMRWNFYEIVSSVGKNPAHISVGNGYPTGINFIDVTPEKSRELIELFSKYYKNVLQNMDGFVSANLHKSDDGKRIVNYVQWNSFDGLTSLFRDEKGREFNKELNEISVPDWNLFKVVYSA